MFSGFNEEFGVFLADTPQFELNPDRVIERDVTGCLVKIRIDANFDFHGVERLGFFLCDGLNLFSAQAETEAQNNSPAPTASPPVFSVTQ